MSSSAHDSLPLTGCLTGLLLQLTGFIINSYITFLLTARVNYSLKL